MRIGVVSDTHGLLRPELLPLLQGCDHILHCGDVGDISILTALESIAPVTAIRGNIDTRGPSAELPAIEVVTIRTKDVYMLHDLHTLDLDPAAAGFAAVLSGHSHQPSIRHEKGVLYLNPGSCGPRRFRLPITCAEILLDQENRMEARILEVPVPS